MDGLDDLKAKYLTAISTVASEAALEDLRVAALGKKGEISALMAGLGKMDPDQRKAAGAIARQGGLNQPTADDQQQPGNGTAPVGEGSHDRPV